MSSVTRSDWKTRLDEARAPGWRGKPGWFKLRKAKQGKLKDLSGYNLRGADLRNADLSQVEMIKVDLKGADLQNANLQGADLSSANLIEVNLKDANLWGANLERAVVREEQLADTLDLRRVIMPGGETKE